MLVTLFVKLKNLYDSLLISVSSIFPMDKRRKLGILKRLRVDLRYYVGRYRSQAVRIDSEDLCNYCGMEMAYKIINNRNNTSFIVANAPIMYSSIEWHSHGNHRLICLIAACICEYVCTGKEKYYELLVKEVDDLFDDEGLFREPSLGYGWVCFSGLWLLESFLKKQLLQPEMIYTYSHLTPFLKTNAFGDFDFGFFDGAKPCDLSLPKVNTDSVFKLYESGVVFVLMHGYSLLAYNRDYKRFINNKHGHNDSLSFVLLRDDRPLVIEKPVLSYMFKRNSSRSLVAHNAPIVAAKNCRLEGEKLKQRFENKYVVLERAIDVKFSAEKVKVIMSMDSCRRNERVIREITVAQDGVVVVDDTHNCAQYKFTLFTTEDCVDSSCNMQTTKKVRFYSNYSEGETRVFMKKFQFVRTNRINIR